LPYSSLKDLDPVVLILVPSPERAKTVAAAFADSIASITVAVWSKQSADAALTTLTSPGMHLLRARQHEP
jgi:hypothetical protein